MKTHLFFQDSKFSFVILAIIFTLLLITYEASSQTPADFSGTWKLDVAKSSSIPNILSATLLITQKENDILIKRTFEIKDQQPLVSTFHYFIGSVIVTNSKTGATVVKSHWNNNKENFSIIETFITEKDGTKQESKRTSVYSLTDKGKTLNIISHDSLPAESITPESERHMKFIYTKTQL
jgi:predicted transcriptional regulator